MLSDTSFSSKQLVLVLIMLLTQIHSNGTNSNPTLYYSLELIE